MCTRMTSIFLIPLKLGLRSYCAFRISNARQPENHRVETLLQSQPRDTQRNQRLPVKILTLEPVLATTSLFRVSLAQTPKNLVECQRLRYLVFNLELKEGLTTSERSGLDIDPFDSFRDHLMVHDLESGKLVGTYRLRLGETARQKFGYYGNQLFDFSTFDPVRKQMLEMAAPASTSIFAISWRFTHSGKASPFTPLAWRLASWSAVARSRRRTRITARPCMNH